MTSTVPIRRLTLYKHGVCFVEREGQLAGEELTLLFRAGEVNDVLKSLLVIDRSGGQVQGIAYETPADGAAHSASGLPALSGNHALLDLLQALRGWPVRIVAGEGSAVEERTGRLIGTDIGNETEPFKDSAVTLLDEESGAVVAIPLALVRRVFLLEQRPAGDLRRFLDASRDKNEQRSITVRLGPGEHDVIVSYLVPSPTWRVSYRLVVESASGNTDTQTSPPHGDGDLLLQGWGVFDNALDEDLEDVAVTLVAGQPISFVYDLAASRIPRRPVVEDEARIAAAPVEFDQAYAAAPLPAGPAERARGVSFAAPAAARGPAAAPPPRTTIAAMERQAVAASGSETGELFQYEVTTPVTAGRGTSVLVPILSHRMPCRRELLFNEDKLPRHPVAALRFTNTTGLVLERGPVTVLEDGAYRGEAMVPFSKEGADVYLAFAVELGITVTRQESSSVETAGIRISGAMLDERQAIVRRTQYRIDNRLGEARRVTVEHPIWPEAELVDTRPPETQTAEFYRWTVECPAREPTLFAVVERRYTWQSTHIFSYSPATLQDYWRRNWLDGTMLSRLTGLLREQAAIAANEEEISRLQTERDEIYARQDQLRKNMAALGTTGDEGALRKRSVLQLQTCEDRLSAIHGRIVVLQEENARRKAAVDEQLAQLQGE